VQTQKWVIALLVALALLYLFAPRHPYGVHLFLRWYA
jgi:hypothetical protein